jgi:hypothetical protein
MNFTCGACYRIKCTVLTLVPKISEEGERGKKREKEKGEKETKGKVKSKFQDAVSFSLRNILP